MNDAIDNLLAYQPSPDAVEQVSVETNNYSAELGNVAGAIVNMVVKSGTNRFMGNGFYYWRDNKLAATPWATSRAGGVKSKFSRNMAAARLAGRSCATRCSSSAIPGPRAEEPAGRLFHDGRARRVAAGRSEQPALAATPSSCAIRSTDNRSRTTRFPSTGSARSRGTCSRTSRCIRVPTSSRALSDFRQNYRASPPRRKRRTSST